MQFRNPFSLAFSVTLSLLLFLGVLLAHPHFSAAAGETAVVTADILNVRSGPGTSYGLASQAGLGDRLPVLDRSGDWYQVALSSGQKGWVASWLVSVEQPQAPAPSQASWLANVKQPQAPAPAQNSGQVAVVSGSQINVRGGPGTSYPLTTQVGNGERFPVLNKSGDWYQVSLSTGNKGWVAGWLVNIVSAGPAVSPPSNPAPSNSGVSQSGGRVAVVSGSSVNVRSGPGTSNGVVGQATQGDNLLVLAQSGDWYHVKTAGGKDGWVAGWLVSVKAAAPVQPQLPAAPQPPADQSGNVEVSRGGSRNTDNQSGKVLSLDVKDSSGKTNAIITANVPFDYTAISMSNPDRLVVDLKGVAIGDLPLSTDVNSKSVRQVRAGYYQKNPDVTRLVFDLSGGAQYVASLSGDQKSLTVQTYVPDINGSYQGKIIAIDAGHGGPDPGALGSLGTKEKEVTLEVAKRVQKLLEARGAKVVMTRAGDQDIGLYERTDKANNAKADIFVSIHINANNDSSIGGTTTYTYNGSDPAQAARIQESSRMARFVQTELVKTLGLRDIGLRDANFAVLRTSNMPAILAELAFISNVSEVKYMNTDVFRNVAAEAIVKGIGRYFSERRSA